MQKIHKGETLEVYKGMHTFSISTVRCQLISYYRCLGIVRCGNTCHAKAVGYHAMQKFDPQLVQVMRNALEEVMTKVPLEYSNSSTKAYLA